MRHSVMLLMLALAGCHASYGFQWGFPAGGYAQPAAVDIRVMGPSDSLAGAILIGVAVADGVSYYLSLPDGTSRPYYGAPESDPARRINVQDCTKPVDIAAGNLMCR